MQFPEGLEDTPLKGWNIRPILDQSNQKCKENLRIKCVSHVEKLKLRFLRNEKNYRVHSHI